MRSLLLGLRLLEQLCLLRVKVGGERVLGRYIEAEVGLPLNGFSCLILGQGFVVGLLLLDGLLRL